jgi:hypothetical protein
LIDRSDDGAIDSGFRLRQLELIQRLRGRQGSRPRPEVLGGELRTSDLAEVVVDVGR